MTRYVLAAVVLALGCNGADEGNGTGTEVDVILALTPDLDNGASLYAANCALCHGDDGAGIQDLGADITAVTDQRTVVEVVLNGNDEGMTAFADFLTDQEVADVSGYVTEGSLGG